MGRLDRLTSRIGLRACGHPRPPDYGPEAKSSMHCLMALVTLPGLRALWQDLGPKTSGVSPGGLVDQDQETSRVPVSVFASGNTDDDIGGHRPALPAQRPLHQPGHELGATRQRPAVDDISGG